MLISSLKKENSFEIKFEEYNSLKFFDQSMLCGLVSRVLRMFPLYAVDWKYLLPLDIYIIIKSR